MSSPALEAFGFVTGVVTVWLLGRQNIWNWPVALVNNTVYLLVFVSAGLYASAGLQLVYAAFGIYGWWSWWRGGQEGELQVQRMGLSRFGVLLVLITVAAIALARLLGAYTDSTVPLADGATTALALAAMGTQSRKYLECWWLWIAADVLYMPLAAAKQLWMTAVLYGVFLLLSIRGLRAWRRSQASA